MALRQTIRGWGVAPSPGRAPMLQAKKMRHSASANPIELLKLGQYSKLIEACKTGYGYKPQQVDFSNSVYLPKINPAHLPRIEQCRWMKYRPGQDNPDPSEATGRISKVYLPDYEKKSTHDGCLNMGFNTGEDKVLRRWFGKYLPSDLARREIACAYAISMLNSLPYTPIQYLPSDQDFSNSHLFVARRFVRGRILSDYLNFSSRLFNPDAVTSNFLTDELQLGALDFFMVGAADGHSGNAIFAPKSRLNIDGLAVIDLEACFPTTGIHCPVAVEILRKYTCTNSGPFPKEWMNQNGLPVLAGSPEFIQTEAAILRKLGYSKDQVVDALIDTQCENNFFMKLLRLKEPSGVLPLSTPIDPPLLERFFCTKRDRAIKAVLDHFGVYKKPQLMAGIDMDQRREWLAKTLERTGGFNLRGMLETIASEKPTNATAATA